MIEEVVFVGVSVVGCGSALASVFVAERRARRRRAAETERRAECRERNGGPIELFEKYERWRADALAADVRAEREWLELPAPRPPRSEGVLGVLTHTHPHGGLGWPEE